MIILLFGANSVTDGIDSRRGLFHSSHSLNTVAEERGPRKSKHDRSFGRRYMRFPVRNIE